VEALLHPGWADILKGVGGRGPWERFCRCRTCPGAGVGTANIGEPAAPHSAFSDKPVELYASRGRPAISWSSCSSPQLEELPDKSAERHGATELITRPFWPRD